MKNCKQAVKFRIINKLIIDKNKLSVILESEEKDSNIRKINLNSILTDKTNRKFKVISLGLTHFKDINNFNKIIYILIEPLDNILDIDINNNFLLLS